MVESAHFAARLKSWTRQQVAVQESLATYLSYRPFVADLRGQIGRAMGELMRTPVTIGRTQLRSMTSAEARELLPQVPCLAILGLAPAAHKLVAECDPGLAALTIERLLGGEGSGETQRIAPPTPLEAGVLSFAVAQVLQHLQAGWFRGSELGLVLDRMADDAGALEALWPETSTLVCVSWGVGVGEMTGGIRLFLPAEIITERFGGRPATPEAEASELAAMRRHLDLLGGMSHSARLVAARVDIDPKDIANISAGDIIILENHGLKKSAEGIAGEIFVHIGAGRHGGFRALLRNDVSEAHRLSIEVAAIVVEEPPMDEQAPAAEAGDNLKETQGLLRDLDAQVVVELGRLRMNTAQVVRLRTGQVLKLARGPTDPVDLVVGGKVFARGELIEVEGELGVRLTQVAGADASA